MRRTFKDPEFPKYFKKLIDDDPSPLGAAELARVMRDAAGRRDVAILQEAFRKAYRDPEFHKEYKQPMTPHL
jgi:hypothetical protein